MAYLIDKDALVAEIERRKNKNQQICTAEGSGAFYEDGFILDIINFLDTLEVEEVDLEKEIVDRWKTIHNAGNEIPFDTFNGIAKHFFELGMAVSNKTQKGE